MAKPRNLTGGQQSQADAVARLQAHHVHLAQRQQRGWVEPFAYGPEAMDTSTREHLFKLHDTPHEDDCGLDSRGYPRMTPQMEVRMSQAGNEAKRVHLTLEEAATLVGVSTETMERGLSKCGIAYVQYGGKYGRRNLPISRFAQYLDCVGEDEQRKAQLLLSANQLLLQQSA